MFEIRFELNYAINPLDKTLHSASVCLSYGSLRFLQCLDWSFAGPQPYYHHSYQAFSREGVPADKRLAEMGYSVAAVVQLLEDEPSRVGEAVAQLRRAVSQSQALNTFRLSSHVEDRERAARAPLCPTSTHHQGVTCGAV